MGFRLRPVDSSFYDLFAEQTRHLTQGAALLAEMLSTSANRDDVAARMRAAEHAADETTHAIVRRVNKTFVTPLDREDIYRLASGLDDVMDAMDEAVDFILLYAVTDLPEGLGDLVLVIQQCADVTAEAMPRLQSLRNLDEYWIEINRLENAGDQSYRRVLAGLFNGSLKALEVLKLKDIAEALESAIDAFEHVANIIEQIAVKES